MSFGGRGYMNPDIPEFKCLLYRVAGNIEVFMRIP